MAASATVQPEPAGPRLAPRQPLIVPDDLRELLGDDVIRKAHARMAAQIKALRNDGTVQWSVKASAGGRVTHSSIDTTERL